MVGFSVYLSAPLTAATRAYMLAMQAAGFSGVFTSLHIPEDDADVLAQRVTQLAAWCRELHLELIADISDRGLAALGWTLEAPQAILATGLTGLRIDDGIDLAAVAKLSHVMPVALNASTLTSDDVATLRANEADWSHLEAWHNYYPRPETGLARDWYAEKNAWLTKLGFTTMAFVPGDGELRGPLQQQLPTLESHRGWSPLAALVDLAQLHTDRIYIGDNTITPAAQAAIAAYCATGTITLHVTAAPAALTGELWHNRPDVAAQVVRLVEGRQRQLLSTAPQPAQARPLGTLTVDNDQYGRYAGELQVTKVDLPANAGVNVLGRVVAADRPLLNLIGANTPIRFVTASRHY
ncbi:MupG family TIM beta-alpha barrel fold protein [Lacticaseibacillus nasuensis]|uniref:MupG family TIM beta-alpha barrel fold protein n=1 Tax=Lacticaseibacillus nasuensis TaxID=944671 RepID=UPI0022468276|nr:MupG family TIM beta-alpha barrel fold protein [Lacticaseibacillus nasuensis]MCX2455270.1 MupG family TIM beta-alpha barrel fold protein [Lacticaseibacillus nasuensis]